MEQDRQRLFVLLVEAYLQTHHGERGITSTEMIEWAEDVGLWPVPISARSWYGRRWTKARERLTKQPA